MWMSHVTHVEESRHTCEWVTSYMWLSHVTHVNESRHTCEWVTSHMRMSDVRTRMRERGREGERGRVWVWAQMSKSDRKWESLFVQMQVTICEHKWEWSQMRVFICANETDRKWDGSQIGVIICANESDHLWAQVRVIANEGLHLCKCEWSFVQIRVTHKWSHEN